MVKEQQFRVTPQVAYNEQNIIEYISREMGIDRRTVTHVHILKKSIDARQKQIYVNLTLRILSTEEPTDEEYVKTEYPDVSKAPQVIVVGAGPCGLFAALRLIELGLKPVILERGKDVRERKKDLALIKSQQSVDPESNYCFGEGGAGAYSDGKLRVTSITKIQATAISADDVVDIYNSNGICLCKQKQYAEALSTLHPGTYVVVRGRETFKITINQ